MAISLSYGVGVYTHDSANIRGFENDPAEFSRRKERGFGGSAMAETVFSVTRPIGLRKYYTDWLTIAARYVIINLMVEYRTDELDDVFHALADPTRRAMLESLAGRPRKVGELASPFEITLAAASKHIKVLERAGLVRRRVEGRTHICSLNAAPLHAGMEWMRHYERFWNGRLDVLEQILEQEDAQSPGDQPGEDMQTKGTKP